jgi:hypothetical protein
MGALTRNIGPEQHYSGTHRAPCRAGSGRALAGFVSGEGGRTSRLENTVTRLCGLTNELRVVAQKLPDGVTCEPALVPGREVKLNMVAGEEARREGDSDYWMGHQQRSGRAIPFKLTGIPQTTVFPAVIASCLPMKPTISWLTVFKEPSAEAVETGK